MTGAQGRRGRTTKAAGRPAKANGKSVRGANGKGEAPVVTARGEATKARLTAAARVVFERDGFIDARITDIAEEAGVAHGSFYTYFDSKDEVFEAVIIHLNEEFQRPAAVIDVPPVNRVESVLRANRAYLETYGRHAALITVWENVASFNDVMRHHLIEYRTPFIERSASSIRRLQDDGLADPSIDPFYAAVALTQMVRAFASSMFTTPAYGLDLETATIELTRIWANAVGMPRHMVDEAIVSDAARRGVARPGADGTTPKAKRQRSSAAVSAPRTRSASASSSAVSSRRTSPKPRT